MPNLNVKISPEAITAAKVGAAKSGMPLRRYVEAVLLKSEVFRSMENGQPVEDIQPNAERLKRERHHSNAVYQVGGEVLLREWLDGKRLFIFCGPSGWTPRGRFRLTENGWKRIEEVSEEA